MTTNNHKMQQWTPIENYQQQPSELEQRELRGLAEVWQEQKSELENTDGLKAFNEQLGREWAIETGLLERLYTLDRGTTQMLIEHGFDAALIPHGGNGGEPERAIAMMRSHQDSLEALFDFVKGQRPLSTSYIRELHGILTKSQEFTEAEDQFHQPRKIKLNRGAYKQRPNNPCRPDGTTHSYCPPEQTASEMDRLIDLHHVHEQMEEKPAPEVEAAWLHHRFTQIHPFEDGNGRVARSLATLVFLRAGWFPLVIRDRKERAGYITALEQADCGDLLPLAGLMASCQKRAFVKALGISREVLRYAQVDHVITAAQEKLDERQARRREEWNGAKDRAEKLRLMAEERFNRACNSLTEKLKDHFGAGDFWVDTADQDGAQSHYFMHQIIETAKTLDYFANLREFRSWVRLILPDDKNKVELLVSFHGMGREFRGVLACSACFSRRVKADGDEDIVHETTSLAPEVFQINYKEASGEAEKRFTVWLEDALNLGLSEWTNGL